MLYRATQRINLLRQTVSSRSKSYQYNNNNNRSTTLLQQFKYQLYQQRCSIYTSQLSSHNILQDAEHYDVIVVGGGHVCR